MSGIAKPRRMRAQRSSARRRQRLRARLRRRAALRQRRRRRRSATSATAFSRCGRGRRDLGRRRDGRWAGRRARGERAPRARRATAKEGLVATRSIVGRVSAAAMVGGGRSSVNLDARAMLAGPGHELSAVVGDGGDGDNRRHGRFFRTRRDALQRTLADWFATPLGRYLLAREQAWFDRTVADIFGFHGHPDRTAGVPVPRAKPDRRRGGRVDSAPPARDPRRSALAAVRRELARPHRAAARARVHERSASAAARGLSRDARRRTDRHLGLQSVQPVRRASAISDAARSPPWNGSFIALVPARRTGSRCWASR